PSSLSGAGASIADATLGAHGDAAMVWTAPAEDGFGVQISTRSTLGSFSSPLTLTPAGAESRAPQVAEDAAGEALAVWYASTGSNFLVEAATVVDGIGSAPVQLSAPGQNAVLPVVAMNERGDAIVAWTRANGGSGETLQAAFRPAGGSFGQPVTLSPEGGFATTPRVAIDAAGDATIVWSQAHGFDEVVETVTRPAASGTFTKAQALSNEAEAAIEPSVAVNGEGDTAVSWVLVNGSDEAAIQAVARPAGDAFGAAVDLTGETLGESSPEVGLDELGDPTVAWTATIGGIPVVYYATGTAAGAFSQAHSLAFEAYGAVLAEDPVGDVLIGYADVQSNVAEASYRPAGGTFGAPQEVSPPGGIAEYGTPGHGDDEQLLSVAMDGERDGLFGFVVETGGGFFAQASLLDTAGVGLEGVSIPAHATAGVPVTFSAQASDRVFPNAELSWAFGDGTSASGSSVTQTFATPGTYSVSVTATAAAGDSATQMGTVTITTPASPPPPVPHPATLARGALAADAHGRVHLPIVCPPGGAQCAGTVNLTLPATATGLALSARASGTPVTIAVGRASFSTPAGTTTTIGVTLPREVLRLLSEHHRLRFSFTLESHDPSGSAGASGSLLVNAYAKPKRHKHRKRK
ncbi:MAG TPA: PKD domain-containing protein, partial [Solirubrobacteraceae bacterium]|nr:PKD domain-containing protein [Solirubrobacteraceae bacterium]